MTGWSWAVERTCCDDNCNKKNNDYDNWLTEFGRVRDEYDRCACEYLAQFEPERLKRAVKRFENEVYERAQQLIYEIDLTWFPPDYASWLDSGNDHFIRPKSKTPFSIIINARAILSVSCLYFVIHKIRKEFTIQSSYEEHLPKELLNQIRNVYCQHANSHYCFFKSNGDRAEVFSFQEKNFFRYQTRLIQRAYNIGFKDKRLDDPKFEYRFDGKNLQGVQTDEKSIESWVYGALCNIGYYLRDNFRARFDWHFLSSF